MLNSFNRLINKKSLQFSDFTGELLSICTASTVTFVREAAQLMIKDVRENNSIWGAKANFKFHLDQELNQYQIKIFLSKTPVGTIVIKPQNEEYSLTCFDYVESILS